MAWRTGRVDGPTKAAVRLDGELDAYSAPSAREALLRRAPCSGEQLRVDMSAVTFIDSSGLGMLVAVSKDLAQRDATMVLVSPGPGVRRLLSLTGLDRLFTVEQEPAPLVGHAV